MFKFRRIIPRSWYFSLVLLLLFIILIISLRNQSSTSDGCNTVCPYISKLTKHSLEFNDTYRIRHYPSFVCPQNFRNLADWIYQWPSQFDEEVQVPTDNAQRIARCLSRGSIIYVRIWAIDDFFRLVYPYLIEDFVLITGEGDLSSPTHFNYLEAPNSKILHWFGQNGQYDVSRFFRFTHIPIGKKFVEIFFLLMNLLLGINCYEMADAISKIHSQQSTHTLPTLFYEIDEPDYYIQPLDVSQRELDDKLLLINFDKGTDKTGLRAKVWDDMCTPEKRKAYPFVTCIDKSKGVHISEISRIYKRNRQYPFWLSPRGNGLDCHRTWEALYLDIIPIVWNSSLSILYEDLPVLIINDHRELTETFLRQQFREISQKKLSKKKIYRYEKLRHAYWREIIFEEARHKDVSEPRRQCWRANEKTSLRKRL